MQFKPVILLILHIVSLTGVLTSEGGGGGLLDGMIQPLLKQFRNIGSTHKEVFGPGLSSSMFLSNAYFLCTLTFSC